MFANDPLAQTDPQLFAAIDQENTRQEQHIELIASENYASPQVLAAQGSQLTNKYAEGYPRKRYYGGCDYVDQVELLAIERARALFGAEYVNVQPHSGSSANAAVCMALLEPHDTILGMALDQGGHLTHGAKVNFSGKTYSAKSYGLQVDGYLDYQQLEQVALEVKPKLIIAGFSAYSRIVDWQAFRRVADMVGAYLLADMAHVAGLVATGHYPSPIAHADVVTTTTHKSLRSARGGMILSRDPELGKKINSSVFPGNQGGPLMHAIAGKAVGFGEALRPEFATYQQQVIDNANTLANKLIENGLAIVSGGTDNHLMLVDLVDKGITGKDLDLALGRCHITVNKNAVPNDPQSPFVTSGIRLGTPAITTRGFGTSECRQIADWITRIADNLGNDSVEQQVCGEVAELCTQFPVYPHS